MIVVTGASRGLGRAICDRLLAQGRNVTGIARNVESLPFPAIACDVSSYSELKAVAATLRHGREAVTGLVNAAGIASMNLAVTTPPATVRRIVDVNLIGTIQACQVFSPLMMRGKAGSIVNFSTIAVAIGLKGESVYAASKAGVEGFSRAFGREVSDFNIRVNCIAPGPIATDLLKGITGAQIDAIIEHQIIRRQYTPEAVCDLVDFLLEDRSSSISGQVLHVGGV